ncbi:alpha-ketoglutarate-dependent dioxygenase AlkB [Sphingomonas sp. JC676]|uniref:alpha-ketoglutarate-dependent dioxygenase AlkB n=1 Tax=Sphingomonas sp. JC676 TaxID=2768065 RepID=UPI0016581AB0|nr:alpha-ketoglutarate-dependent dioxygenase AlkB [Sphingomonas sp. JC676]MBC9032609.1 alpha-ketoglutarate-dependent dioxygenase AlkB [Sphingomonas sp. JC676]
MTAFALDLFGAPNLPGLLYRDDFVSPEDESILIAGVESAPLAPFRFQGWLGKRLTASFGWRYDFEDASFRETAPIPHWLLPLRERAAAFAGLAPDDLVQLLLTRYDPGAGIGWHRDRPVFEHVIGISLGNPATLGLRRRRPGGFDRFSAPLAPRSIYRLSGEARHEWEHSIAPMEVPRWSITFRSLSDKGHKLAAST